MLDREQVDAAEEAEQLELGEEQSDEVRDGSDGNGGLIANSRTRRVSVAPWGRRDRSLGPGAARV